jgi:hypothetical protein
LDYYAPSFPYGLRPHPPTTIDWIRILRTLLHVERRRRSDRPSGLPRDWRTDDGFSGILTRIPPSFDDERQSGRAAPEAISAIIARWAFGLEQIPMTSTPSSKERAANAFLRSAGHGATELPLISCRGCP